MTSTNTFKFNNISPASQLQTGKIFREATVVVRVRFLHESIRARAGDVVCQALALTALSKNGRFNIVEYV